MIQRNSEVKKEWKNLRNVPAQIKGEFGEVLLLGYTKDGREALYRRHDEEFTRCIEQEWIVPEVVQ